MAESFVNTVNETNSGTVEQNKKYFESFYRTVSELRENEFTCDVVVKINGQRINAHKLVLAAGSPYFAMCFFGRLAGQQQIPITEIECENLKFSAVDRIIQYFYSSKIEINERTVLEILRTADYLQVEWVQEKCLAYIKKTLTTSNCIDFWHFAESLCYDQPSADLVRFILQNLSEISTQPKFLCLSNERIQQIISHKFHSINLRELYMAIIKWTNHDVENRRPIFNEFVQKFPFENLDEEFVKTYLVNEDLIITDHNCLKLFANSLSYFLSRTKDRNTDFDSRVLGFIKKPISTPYIFVLTAACKRSVIEFYNPYEECSEYVPPPNTIFPYSAAVAYKDFICISGGLHNLEARRNFIMYNTVSDYWISTQFMNSGKAYHDMIVCNDALYTCGVDYELERFDIATNTWTEIDITTSALGTYEYGQKCISADVLDGRIFAVGGNQKRKNEESILQSFDPRVGEWQHEINTSGFCSILNFNNNLYMSSTNYSYLVIYDIRNQKNFPASSSTSQPPSFSHTLTRFGKSIFLFDADTKNVKTFNQLQNQWVETKPTDGCLNYVRAVTPDMFDIW